MHAIGIDIGTTNVKGVVVDLDDDGALVADASAALRWQRDGDVAEQDAAALWAAVLDVLGALRAAAPDGAAAVGVVGLCGQYSSIVPVDASAQPVGPMRLYLDQRGTAPSLEVLGRHEEAFLTWVERHPIPPVGGGLALGHVLSLQLDSPRAHERTRAYLEAGDYVVARLTGTIATTQAGAYLGQLVDNRTLDASGYDEELVRLAGVDPDRLPPLVPLGSVVGGLADEVASAVGLPAGTPVVTPLTDSAAQAVATGADREGRVGAVIGTTSVLLSSAPAMAADFDHELFTMPGARPDRYLVSAENGIAGRAVEHLLGSVLRRADDDGDPFDGFEAALAASPAGARGVRFLPWLSGSMSPQNDPAMRGGLVGMSLEAGRDDVVRAAAEGVAHGLRWLLGPLEAFCSEAADEVVLTGGAARSPGWAQVVADVLDRPVHALADPTHSGARAAATWAAACLAEAGAPRGDAAVATQPLGATCIPDPAAVEVHAAAHAQFTAAFEALRPLGLGRP
ncbi:MAG: FGGY-family carbohydrate kinase [Acidimicrobiales bacterium]